MSFDYAELQSLSHAALACTDASIRESAADTLRCLSSYESFSFVKKAIRELDDSDVHSIFIVCKSLRFVVCNELGPSERKAMQSLALSVIRDKLCNMHSFQTPTYIIKSLFSIYACAQFLNWRIMLVNGSWYSDSVGNTNQQQQNGSGGGEQGAAKQHLGKVVIEEISEIICNEPKVVLQGLIEVINTFTMEDAKSGTKVLRTAISTELLPSLLQFGARYIRSPVAECARLALELCTLAFENTSKFAGLAPLLVVQLTTEESRYLHPAPEWLPAMQEVASYCKSTVLEELPREYPSEHFYSCLSLLSSMSTAFFSDWRESGSLLTLTDGFMRELVGVAATLIETFSGRPKWDDDSLRLLEVGVAIMTNVFERNDLFVGSYIVNNIGVLRYLCGLCVSFIGRIHQAYLESNVELIALLDKARSSLLHLFFVIGEKGVPPQIEGDSNTLRTQIIGLILDASKSYFDSVVHTSHLQADSFDVEQGGFLNNMDQQLSPLAEMLFSDSVDLLCVVDSSLSWTLSLHATCAQLKSILSSGGEVSYSTIDMDQVNELDALCRGSCQGRSVYDRDGLNLVLNVLLSRLSVIFALIGLSVKRRSEYGPRIRNSDDKLADFTLVNRVVAFAEQLISADHDITHMLLECMTMVDSTDDGSPSSSHLTDEQHNKLNAATRDASEAQGKLHLGILRSLFYFSHCVHGTPFARQCSALEFMAELILFAIVDHSDCIPLVHDANKLLKDVLQERTALTALPQIKHLLEQHAMGHIVLTRPDFVASDPVAKQMRRDTLTNLVQLSDYRVDGTLQPFMDLVKGEVDEDLYQFLDDVSSVCAGIVYASSHKVVVRMLAEERQRIVDSIKRVHSAAQGKNDIIRLAGAVASCWSKVTLNCYALLDMENVCMDSWAFAGLCFDSLNFTLQSVDPASLASGGNWLSSIVGAPESEVDAETLIYDVCSVLRGTFLGKWCNIGVMLHYGDDSVQNVFMATITQISRIPVEILVSHEVHVDHVYSSIYAALTISNRCGALGSSLKALEVWGDVATILTHCIEHQFNTMALTALHHIVRDSSIGVYNISDVAFVCCTALITLSLTQMDVLNLVETIEASFHRNPEAVESSCNYLLEISSAIHRVRIRTLLTSLRSPSSGSKSIAETYLSVFGTNSEVVTVAAW